MTLKTIKISEENYRWLVARSGEIQSSVGRPVSIDKTLSVMRTKNLEDLRGSWKMSDEETKAFMKDLRAHWKRWKTPQW
jgi:predicted CopG family antitoxin